VIRQRTFWKAAEALLLVACAGYWFGNTGLGLAVLWLSVSGQPRVACADSAGLVGSMAVWVSEHRLLLRTDDGRRIEIYRDEVSAREWATLKRLGLNGQLATGRNTSI